MKLNKVIWFESMTSGRKLYGEAIKTSTIRKFFMLPWIYCYYHGRGMRGPSTVYGWYYPRQIEGLEMSGVNYMLPVILILIIYLIW